MLRSGHIVDFIITSEEAIAKGIRRIVALTGPEAEKARKKTALLEHQINELKGKVDGSGDDALMKDITKEINDLNIDVSQATIPYVKKDEFRNTIKELKKKLADREKALKAAVATFILEQTKQLCEKNPDAKFFVHQFTAYNNTKALDSALKQMKTTNPETSALFVSVDEESKKIFCMAAVSKSGIEKGLKANEWVQQLSSLLGGKGGGKAESAQASGTNFEKVNEIIDLAKKFASSKLD